MRWWTARAGLATQPRCGFAGWSADVGRDSLAVLLVEASGPPEEAAGSIARGLAAGRAILASLPPGDVVASVRAAAPSCAVAAARWSGSRLSYSALGCPSPFLLRGGRAVRVAAAGEGPRKNTECETRAGDLVVLASNGLEQLRFEREPRPSERLLEDLARHAEGQPLQSAFGRAVSEWKAAGISPGAADVVLLAARKAP